MNESTPTPAREDVVPVPVPVPASTRAPVEPPFARALESRPSSSPPPADQLPTARVQTIPPPLPPPVPPPGPAHKTQPLRTITRADAAAKLAAERKRPRWEMILGQVKRAAVAVPSRIGGIRSEAWTERRLGIACGAIGLAMIAGALALGWQSVASDRLERMEHVSLAVAVTLARAAIAIATMVIGYGLLRVGERTLVASRRGDAPARTR